MTSRLVLFPLTVAVIAISSLVVVTKAKAHDAPSGWSYPPGCCNSAADSPTGDCAPIDARYVTEEADGYHVNLPAGAHPMLKTKGYQGVVPYSNVKDSEDGAFHICLSYEGMNRFCFFAGPRLG